jgi:hypothetical protein
LKFDQIEELLTVRRCSLWCGLGRQRGEGKKVNSADAAEARLLMRQGGACLARLTLWTFPSDIVREERKGTAEIQVSSARILQDWRSENDGPCLRLSEDMINCEIVNQLLTLRVEKALGPEQKKHSVSDEGLSYRDFGI